MFKPCLALGAEESLLNQSSNNLPNFNMGKIVYYDLETTGLKPLQGNRGVQIISIGAVTDRGQWFQNFINPTCAISSGASRINGLYHDSYGDLVDSDGDDIEDVQTPYEGLGKFLDWLQNVGCRYLVSHR